MSRQYVCRWSKNVRKRGVGGLPDKVIPDLFIECRNNECCFFYVKVVAEVI